MSRKSFDDILKQIGQFGKAQILFYVLLGLCGIPTGEQNLSSIFVSGFQNHWCSVAQLKNLSEEQQKYISIPKQDGNFLSCVKYVQDYQSFSEEDFKSWNRTIRLSKNILNESCSEWSFSQKTFTSTISSQFNLVCTNEFLVQLVTTLYMAGFLTGCVLFGILSDKIGRLKTLTITLGFIVVFGLIAAVIPWFWLYVICRFLVGMGAAGCYTTAFVIIMEIIGPNYRMVPGILMQGWFALGFIILTGLSYFIRNHIVLQLCISLPNLLLLSYYWFIPESPRWLMSQDRFDESQAVCFRLAKMNGRPLPEDFNLRKEIFDSDDKAVEINYATPQGTIVDLIRTPNMRQRSLNVFFNWFVNSLVYYGLSLNADKLPGTLHVNALLSAVVEIPSYVACCIFMDRLGRKICLISSLIIGGVACLICAFLQDNENLLYLVITLALIGKFGISASFAIIYVYTAEVMPTVVRNVGVGTSSMFARVASLVAPQTKHLSKIWVPLPYLVFGAFSITAGILALLLPETLGQNLPETLEDGENFGQFKKDNFDVGDEKTKNVELSEMKSPQV